MVLTGLACSTGYADQAIPSDYAEFVGTPYEILTPGRLRLADTEGVRTAIANDPAAWIDAMRRTPMLGASSAWSCICGRMLQLDAQEPLQEWLGSLAGGSEQEPEAWLSLDSAEAGLPPNHANAVIFGVAVSGCILALHDLARHDAAAADAALRGMLDAVGAPIDPASELPTLSDPQLSHRFWPETLDNSTLQSAFGLGLRGQDDRLTCQAEIRDIWAELLSARDD